MPDRAAELRIGDAMPVRLEEPFESGTFDEEEGGPHAAELYVADQVAERIPVADAKGEAARLHYAEHGWLAVRNVLDPAEVAEAFAATDDLILGRVPGFKGIMYERAVRSRLAGMSAEERYDAVRKLFRFAEVEPRLARLTQQRDIIGICHNLLGGRALTLFQDMALLKPPLIGREKPWHQDHAFFNLHVDTRFVGVWIALDPATAGNGCMHVLDRGHREGPRTHFKRRDIQICDVDVLGRGAVAFPLEPGDAMFFDGLLPHGTPANQSRDRRRALQFHYVPADAVEVASSARLALFGAEGKDATC